MKEMHERLKWARSQKNIKTASDAARKYGWNENVYRSHENGARGFKKDTAEVYANAYGVNVNWLYFNDGSATGPSETKDSKRELMETIEKWDEEMLKALAILAKGMKGK